MFQLLRRVSGSFLPRPDRPWRDDATSHAPTIGRKRRYSITEQDDHDSASSIAKRTKNNHPVKLSTECDSESEKGSTKGDTVPLVEVQEVKEVTKGVKEVDLEDEDKAENASSVLPEGVPLPDSPSRSPEPESESPEPESESPESAEVEETKDEEYADDTDSVASSAPEDGTEEEAEANTHASVDGTAPAQVVTIATIESGLHDIPETLEVKA